MKTTVLIGIVAILVIALGVVIAVQKTPVANTAATSTNTSSAPSTTDSSNPLLTNPSNPAPVTPSPSSNPLLNNQPSNQPAPGPATPAPTNEGFTAHKVVLKTDKGAITLNLFPEDAPNTVKNFVTLGKRGYYNGIIFHRVIKGFMVQAGDPTGTGRGGESVFGKAFPDEINKHKIVKGTLAMANAGPNTNGSQFFIMAQTQPDSSALDGHYTSFGQTADDASQSVVQTINEVPTDSNDKPVQDVKITGFDIIQP